MIDPNTPNRIAAEYEEELASLRQQLAEAKKDAERYRWLRYNNNGGMVEVSISDTESGMAWLYKEHDLDAAIDQAMKGE